MTASSSALNGDLFAPPLGTRTRYCFDPEIGGPTLTEVERVEADDVTHTVSLEAEVTDAALDPATALGDASTTLREISAQDRPDVCAEV